MFVALAEKARHSEVTHVPTGFESALPVGRGVAAEFVCSYYLGGLDQVVLTGLGKMNWASRPPSFGHLGGSHDVLLTQERELLASS